MLFWVNSCASIKKIYIFPIEIDAHYVIILYLCASISIGSTHEQRKAKITPSSHEKAWQKFLRIHL